MMVRGGYLASNLIILGIYAFVHMKINSKKGKGFREDPDIQC